MFQQAQLVLQAYVTRHEYFYRLGFHGREADSSIRISLSYTNTDADVDYILEQLPPIVMRL